MPTAGSISGSSPPSSCWLMKPSRAMPFHARRAHSGSHLSRRWAHPVNLQRYSREWDFVPSGLARRRHPRMASTCRLPKAAARSAWRPVEEILGTTPAKMRLTWSSGAASRIILMARMRSGVHWGQYHLPSGALPRGGTRHPMWRVVGQLLQAHMQRPASPAPPPHRRHTMGAPPAWWWCSTGTPLAGATAGMWSGMTASDVSTEWLPLYIPSSHSTVNVQLQARGGVSRAPIPDPQGIL
mmetsp:Transcript_61197/g.193856  ORF Transcript_61197/g.193856 Transcript_61197/m.193856 type:complete len:240 (+) Transcript_61197:1051-1770(+)